MRTILQRVCDGETPAVHDCLAEYGGLVWRMAKRYLNTSTGDVEDAVQEVFVELWLKADRFDPARGTEPAFVATVAHRRLTDYQRRITSRRRTAIAASQARALPSSSTHSEGQESVSSTAEVTRSFNELPDEERSVIWLAVHQGLTQRQISEATSTPIGTVKTRIRRGMSRLAHATLDAQEQHSRAGASI